MADKEKTISVLGDQLTALADTRTNLAGLIEKATTIQLELMEEGLDEFSEEVGKVFSKISNATEELQECHDRMEMERNRLQNE